MKELLYYAIFAIILYFLLSSVFENFYLEQENYDPSVVPVSSIVTLAKIAEKLANNSGLLTIPSNLNLNSGNLTVTGSTNIVGQATTSGPNGSLLLNKFNWYSKDKIARLKNSSNANDILTIDSSGNIRVNGNLTTYGYNMFNNGGTQNLLPHSDGKNYLRKNVILGSNASICARGQCDGAGTITTPGNINVAGKLTGRPVEEFMWVLATIFSIRNNLGRLPRCPDGSRGYNCGMDPWAGLKLCEERHFTLPQGQPNDCLCNTYNVITYPNGRMDTRTYQRIKKGETCSLMERQ